MRSDAVGRGTTHELSGMRGASEGGRGGAEISRIVRELYLLSSTPLAHLKMGGRIVHPFGGSTARP